MMENSSPGWTPSQGRTPFEKHCGPSSLTRQFSSEVEPVSEAQSPWPSPSVPSRPWLQHMHGSRGHSFSTQDSRAGAGPEEMRWQHSGESWPDAWVATPASSLERAVLPPGTSGRSPSAGPSAGVAASQQHSPYAPSQQHSPYAPSQQRSPYASSQQHSPYASSQQHSPYAKSQQHSPYAPSQQHSPYAPSQQHSPYAPSQQHSPYSPSRQHSPYAPSRQHNPYAPSQQHSPYAAQRQTHAPQQLRSPHAASSSSELSASPALPYHGWAGHPMNASSATSPATPQRQQQQQMPSTLGAWGGVSCSDHAHTSLNHSSSASSPRQLQTAPSPRFPPPTQPSRLSTHVASDVTLLFASHRDADARPLHRMCGCTAVLEAGPEPRLGVWDRRGRHAVSCAWSPERGAPPLPAPALGGVAWRGGSGELPWWLLCESSAAEAALMALLRDWGTRCGRKSLEDAGQARVACAAAPAADVSPTQPARRSPPAAQPVRSAFADPQAGPCMDRQASGGVPLELARAASGGLASSRRPRRGPPQRMVPENGEGGRLRSALSLPMPISSDARPRQSRRGRPSGVPASRLSEAEAELREMQAFGTPFAAAALDPFAAEALDSPFAPGSKREPCPLQSAEHSEAVGAALERWQSSPGVLARPAPAQLQPAGSLLPAVPEAGGAAPLASRGAPALQRLGSAGLPSSDALAWLQSLPQLVSAGVRQAQAEGLPEEADFDSRDLARQSSLRSQELVQQPSLRSQELVQLPSLRSQELVQLPSLRSQELVQQPSLRSQELSQQPTFRPSELPSLLSRSLLSAGRPPRAAQGVLRAFSGGLSSSGFESSSFAPAAMAPSEASAFAAAPASDRCPSPYSHPPSFREPSPSEPASPGFASSGAMACGLELPDLDDVRDVPEALEAEIWTPAARLERGLAEEEASRLLDWMLLTEGEGGASDDFDAATAAFLAANHS